MEIKERISRAKIQIQQRNSFFAYLSLFLKFKEDNNRDTASVNVRGDFSYNVEFLDGLDDDELQGVIIHEIMHLALLHLTILGNKDRKLWNISTDLAINTMIVNNGFRMPRDVVVADYNDKFNKLGLEIEKVSSKSADEIYDEFWKQIDDEEQEGKGKGKGKGNGNYEDYKGFDEHEYSQLSETEKKAVEKEILDKLREAYTISQMKGDLPSGMDRVIGELGKQKINWKNVLNKFISNSLPYDYTYSKPSKKSISIGEYMPSVHKEKIDVSVVIDLSGSVGDEEFNIFFTEIVGLARAYQERIDMEVYTHDTECYYSGKVRNGNIERLRSLEFKGGGGTSFQCVVNKLNEMKKNPKCVIWITDGYAEEIDKQKYPILWVLTKDGDDTNLIKSGRVIRLEE